jgi:hypothetical protein
MDAAEPRRDSPQGGSIEPSGTPGAAGRAPRLRPAAGERYELTDSVDGVTHRLERLEPMIAKAEALGATRFIAVTPDGKRSSISKTSGEWTRDPPVPQVQPPSPPAPRHISELLPPIATRTSEDPAMRQEAADDRQARRARIEAALNERYVIRRAPIRIGDVSIGHTEYRHRGDSTRIAFTESSFRLSTETNSPSVARSMVDVAEARGWNALQVSGHEDFRRLIWLEASLRDLKTVGYEPIPGDHERLRKEAAARSPIPREARPAAGANASPGGPKASGRGGGGRRAVLVALEAVLLAQRVPAAQREAVMAAAEENLRRRLDRGEIHRVRVYDKTAAPARAPALPTRVASRDHDRPPPAR